jgi:hypothetical protein
MQKNTVTVNASGDVVISFGQAINEDFLIYRMTQLLPILIASARSDEVMASNEGDFCENRIKANLAIEMLFSAALSKAEDVAEKIGQVSTGDLLASQFGFPEFDDDADDRIAD